MPKILLGARLFICCLYFHEWWSLNYLANKGTKVCDENVKEVHKVTWQEGGADGLQVDCSGRPFVKPDLWMRWKITGVGGIEVWGGKQWVNEAGAWQAGGGGTGMWGGSQGGWAHRALCRPLRGIGFFWENWGTPEEFWIRMGSMRPTHFSFKELLLKKKKDFIFSEQF